MVASTFTLLKNASYKTEESFFAQNRSQNSPFKLRYCLLIKSFMNLQNEE